MMLGSHSCFTCNFMFIIKCVVICHQCVFTHNILYVLTDLDMLTESGDTGGWLPCCSHDPIQLVAIKSPTPTHRYNNHIVVMVICFVYSLPFGVGLELTIPPAPPSTAKSDILDLLDSIPNVSNPLGVSPSPPKLLPHRLYWFNYSTIIYCL